MGLDVFHGFSVKELQGVHVVIGSENTDIVFVVFFKESGREKGLQMENVVFLVGFVEYLRLLLLGLFEFDHVILQGMVGWLRVFWIEEVGFWNEKVGLINKVLY